MPEPTTAPIPERALAAAVIEQAWHDASTAPVKVSGATSVARPSAVEHLAARMFLTAPGGDWAREREVWAQRAGLDAEALRSRAERALPPAAVSALPAHRPPDVATAARVLEALRRAAEAGQRAPSNTALARELGLSAELVAHHLRRLRLTAAITIDPPGQRRVIAAADGSWRTAQPGETA